jgi:hypothetical protein
VHVVKITQSTIATYTYTYSRFLFTSYQQVEEACRAQILLSGTVYGIVDDCDICNMFLIIFMSMVSLMSMMSVTAIKNVRDICDVHDVRDSPGWIFHHRLIMVWQVFLKLKYSSLISDWLQVPGLVYRTLSWVEYWFNLATGQNASLEYCTSWGHFVPGPNVNMGERSNRYLVYE